MPFFHEAPDPTRWGNLIARPQYASEARESDVVQSLVVTGVPVTGFRSVDDAASQLIDLALNGKGGDVHLVNAYTAVLSDTDEELRGVLRRARLNLCDGKPLAWLTRRAQPGTTQVPGPELFERVLVIGQERGLRHFLLGGTPELLTALEDAIRSIAPHALLVGKHSPPFRTPTHLEQVAQDGVIRSSRPDVVWVGLGTPKQDFEAARLAARVGCLCVAVGAAFDFTASAKRRAPAWISKLGFEWLFRLAQEPRRLWRRYLIGNVQFISIVLRDAKRRSSGADRTRP